VIPVVVLLISVYLVIAPIVDKPQACQFILGKGTFRLVNVNVLHNKSLSDYHGDKYEIFVKPNKNKALALKVCKLPLFL
jgi:hypothetical protein